MIPARFTERARQVINYAHDEALKLNHSQVDTEHLLLGLMREGKVQRRAFFRNSVSA